MNVDVYNRIVSPISGEVNPNLDDLKEICKRHGIDKATVLAKEFAELVRNNCIVFFALNHL